MNRLRHPASTCQNGTRRITPRIPPCSKAGRANSSPGCNLRGDEHILDVGCGDGKVTAEIARAVPRGSVLGVDASAEMIAFAQKTFPPSKISNLKFQICDARKIGVLTGEALIWFFPTPRLHWVDDHEAILRGAAAC